MSDAGLRSRCVAGAERALSVVDAACAAEVRRIGGGGDASEVLVVTRNATSEALRRGLADRDRARRLLVAVVGEGSSLTLKDVATLIEAGAEEVVDAQADREAAKRASMVVARWCEVELACQEARADEGMIGASPAWRAAVREVIQTARFSEGPILIGGESGTGKQVLAELAHREQVRRGKSKGDMVTLDCTTLQRELSGSELFGHVKGAFTGATSDREGAIGQADGKVLFLDEIGDLALDVQASLLRSLQEQKYKPVGSDAWKISRFRLVCATHRDLPEEVAAGRFRLDLFHRIGGNTCVAPSLRERRSDVGPLFEHFYKLASGDKRVRVAPAVLQYLERREFPGNVREVRRLAEATARNDVGSGEVTVGMLPRTERERLMAVAGVVSIAAKVGEKGGTADTLGTLVESLLDRELPLREIARIVEDEAITRALARHGLQRKAAQALGVTERALQLRRQRAQA